MTDRGPAGAPRLLCVVLHDVAPPHRTRCEQMLRCLQGEAPDLPVTLLAVPRYHLHPPQAAFDLWLDGLCRSGHELALHGYTHRDDGVPTGWLDRLRRQTYTDGEGEFAALPRLDAALRLQEGMRWFARNGWPLHGFVAPAWLLSAGTWEALAASPLRYTCTLSRLVALPGRPAWHSRSVVYSTRSAWRRLLSLAWNRWVAGRQRRQPLLRLELHPGDIEHPAIRASWLRILRQALRDRRAVTLSQAVERLLPADATRQEGQDEAQAPAPRTTPAEPTVLQPGLR
jgi:predicted deacetylase